MSIYSTLFWAGQAPTSTTVLYTVPGLMTVVVRDIELSNLTGAVLSMNIACSTPGFSDSILYRVFEVPNFEPGQWSGRAVLPAGSTIYTAAPAPGAFLHISGYLLSP